MRLYELSTVICEGCLPDELEGIEPLRDHVALEFLRCDRCGRAATDSDAESRTQNGTEDE